MEPVSASIVASIVAAGVSYGILKGTLNGTVARVVKIEGSVETIAKEVKTIAEDVAFIKGVQHQEGLDRKALEQ